MAASIEVILTVILVATFSLSASYKIAYPDKIPAVLSKLFVINALGVGEHAGRLLGGVVLGLEAFVAAALAFRFSVKPALSTAIFLCITFLL